jgi:hypothetical protein
MKKLITIVILSAAVCMSAAGQRKLTEVDLTVNGIRSGSTLRQVQKLGKPQRIKDLGLNECADLFERTMYFPGLEIRLLGSKNGKRANVYSLIVTSHRWTIAPGLRMGANRRTVLQKFGLPVVEENGSISYVTKENLGMVSFDFRNNRLVRAEMMETLC